MKRKQEVKRRNPAARALGDPLYRRRRVVDSRKRYNRKARSKDRAFDVWGGPGAR